MSRPIDPSLLRCPACHSGDLQQADDQLTCAGCGQAYAVRDGKFVFHELTEGDVTDSIDRIKYLFKKLGPLYHTIVHIVSPICWQGEDTRFIRDYITGRDVVALNVGSGNSDLSPQVSNSDIFAYDNVDLVCDNAAIPLKDNSVDVVLNTAVLEHVPNPEAVVAEMHRVLKPGGVVFTKMPFMMGFHASPYDFSRRTYEGMKVLHGAFELISLKPYGGPTSALLWMGQEWIAQALSFGIKPLHKLIWAMALLTTWPIKFLDYLLVHHPMAKNTAAGFAYTGRKRVS